MRQICVVYLARALNGPEPFEQFLRSYEKFPAGIDHDFLIVFKGFSERSEAQPYLERAKAFRPGFVYVSDSGFDLRAYREAACRFEYPYFCFFNSFSELLAENWLEKLYSVVQQPAVGLAGTTGSCESMYTNVLIERTEWKSPSLVRRLWTPFRLQLCRLCFDPFPNYHLRTNGFILPREIMLKVWPKFVLTKRAAYLFENGKNSLTKRVSSLGLKVLVVGRDGRSFKKEEWPQSRTFRSGDQDNLLVADNQTRQYQNAVSETREHLAKVAWGH